MTNREARLLFLLALTGVLPLAACGGSDDDDGSTVAPTSTLVPGDDDSPTTGDDDDSSPKPTPPPYNSIRDCAGVAGDGGGVNILFDLEEILKNANPQRDYSFTYDIEVSEDGWTVLESFEDTLYISTDQGCTFKPVGEVGVNRFKEITYAPSDRTRMVLSSYDVPTIITTEDGGATFQTQEAPGEGAVGIAIDPNDSDFIRYVSAEGKLVTSTDFGTTWDTKVISMPSGSRANTALFHPSDLDTIVVGTSTGGFIRTDNGGSTWEDVNSTLFLAGENPDNTELTGMFVGVSPINPDLYYGVVMKNYASSEIIRSENAGQSWTVLSKTSNDGYDVAVSAGARVYPDVWDEDRFYFWYGMNYPEVKTDFYIADYSGNGTFDLQVIEDIGWANMYSIAFAPEDAGVIYLGRVNDERQRN